jgi:hypothetical protein
MKRRWNLSIWVGFLFVLAAPPAYLTVFIRFLDTRDAPWAALLQFALGIGLTARGLRRAFREPRVYRGRIAGSILLGLGVACLALFATDIFYIARQVPLSKGAPRVGQRAPEFALPDTDGNLVTLASLFDTGADKVNGAVLIFYRGYW